MTIPTPFVARLRTEQALSECEERTRLSVSHALDAVITIDLDGHHGGPRMPDREVAKGALAHGAFDYLAKPVGGSLRQSIERALMKRARFLGAQPRPDLHG